MEKVWMLKRTSVDLREIAEKCNISENLALMLANRGIKDIKEINRFLYGSLEDLYDPFLMKDMDIGIDLIIDAINEDKKILVYGDYDADGVTSTTILYKAIMQCGGDVYYYIPDREGEGYGMSSNRIQLLKQQGMDVIITCDNGISAIKEVELAKELGMDVIITDHHELTFITNDNGEREYIIPSADAVINPKQVDCTYPFKSLCGAGIAFKFVQALFSELGFEEEEAYESIELAGIGTICDVVDLVDENRIIVKESLGRITNSNNLGINALKKILGIGEKKISVYNIGFQIGPCINATGRLDKASLSVELLLCEEFEEAEELAKKLYSLNKERQDLTNKNAEEAILQVQNSDMKNRKILLLYRKNMHESIAGIVAGKVKERFNLPTIVFTQGKEMPKGSGRSIEEYNMFEELLKCKDIIHKFGGHSMAAGLSIKEENIEVLSEMLNKNCNLSEADFKPKIRIDKRVAFENINTDLISEIETMEPFGKGNPMPLFAEKNIHITNVVYLGKDKNTIKLYMEDRNKRGKFEGICFSRTNELKEIVNSNKNINLDLIFLPYINEYMGKKDLQLKIVDFRVSS